MNIQRLSNFLRVNTHYKNCIAGCVSQRIADFPEKYDYKTANAEWYNVWEKNKYFTRKDGNKDPIRMILPPPNITGSLHLGHALDTIVQDVLARWYRMKGHPVLWVPGLDHAGIATELIVKRQFIREEGEIKLTVQKQELLERIWKWKGEKEGLIRAQLKSLGATLHWDREYFTMSEEMHKAVIEAFIRLNDKNLLYRKKAFVNWCPTLRTSISDLEVEHVFLEGKTEFVLPGYGKKIPFGQIAQIAFPVEDLNEELVVSTTRPETLLGDVALAVHPDDERYSKYVGRRVWHILREEYIPIVADPAVDKEFGTGVLKITPSHDATDFEIAQKHKFELIDVIDDRGRLTDSCGRFKRLPRFTARQNILDYLASKGFLRSIKDHKMAIPRCSRSGDVIESMLKEQWFLRCKGMAEKALEAVKNGTLKIDPIDQTERWYHTLGNMRDWILSRQISWGHRIPAYKLRVGDKSEWIVARSEEEAKLIAQQKYGDTNSIQLAQDKDVLDTWFSSGILPFSCTGWPNNVYKENYPLTLMVTGHDILLFWVARMVMLGLELTNELPFKEVLLHGMVCDANGRKMSKTSGNVILPENIINGISLQELNEQIKQTFSVGGAQKSDIKRMVSLNNQKFPMGVPECGADALRMYLCSSPIKSSNINFDIMKCKADRNFCNKIWQASRYILAETDGSKSEYPETFTTADRWILSRLATMVEIVNNAMARREFREATAAIKNFFYYQFCDYYLEATKWGFRSENEDVARSHKFTLIKCLEVSLRICSPFMPFITEDLYKRLSCKLPEFQSFSSLLEASYPLPKEFIEWKDESLDEQINQVIDTTVTIRTIIAGISKQMIEEVQIAVNDTADYDFYKDNFNLLKAGSKLYNISLVPRIKQTTNRPNECLCTLPNCSILFKAKDAISLEKMKKNIELKVQISEVKDARQIVA